ncbi:hypothetical protein TrCOL_g19 [Triparma columacea]|uniref:DUF4281 domain-containing protein n=1 Tax=Triparma columacea TaxID=722753 RepID=A0A9W7FYE2_9STRA|nr:hypothetical protein TrCOL_g19 [Triparma columacea]
MNPDNIFPLLNGVLVGWGLLLLRPRWERTPAITLLIAQCYAVAYSGILFFRAIVDPTPFPSGGSFSTLSGVAAIFSDRPSLLAGWTHYISFDLLVGRYCLLDSQKRGIPHYMFAPVLPILLLVGPAGLAAYGLLTALWSAPKKRPGRPKGSSDKTTRKTSKAPKSPKPSKAPKASAEAAPPSSTKKKNSSRPKKSTPSSPSSPLTPRSSKRQSRAPEAFKADFSSVWSKSNPYEVEPPRSASREPGKRKR